MAKYEKLEEEIRQLKQSVITESITNIFSFSGKFKRCVSPVDSASCNPKMELNKKVVNVQFL